MNKNRPLMPKATAVWLIENTSLTFDQIADFCGLHRLEVQGIADGEVAKGIAGTSPIATGQVSADEVKRCERDPTSRLQLSEEVIELLRNQQRSKRSSKYTPIARRQDKPDAVAWLLKNCPEMTDTQIIKLIGTTKATINAVRDRTHWNIANIKPKDPVLLGICTQVNLDRAHEYAKSKFQAKQAEHNSVEISENNE
jgi:hypothetical protein